MLNSPHRQFALLYWSQRERWKSCSLGQAIHCRAGIHLCERRVCITLIYDAVCVFEVDADIGCGVYFEIIEIQWERTWECSPQRGVLEVEPQQSRSVNTNTHNVWDLRSEKYRRTLTQQGHPNLRGYALFYAVS